LRVAFKRSFIRDLEKIRNQSLKDLRLGKSLSLPNKQITFRIFPTSESFEVASVTTLPYQAW